MFYKTNLIINFPVFEFMIVLLRQNDCYLYLLRQKKILGIYLIFGYYIFSKVHKLDRVAGVPKPTCGNSFNYKYQCKHFHLLPHLKRTMESSKKCKSILLLINLHLSADPKATLQIQLLCINWWGLDFPKTLLKLKP